MQTPFTLPLGELSPQVTERALQPVLDRNVYLFAHTTKVSVDVPVGKSQDFQAQSRQKRRTFCVIYHTLRRKMLRTIHFDNQLCRSTVKVYDKPANNPLLVNLNRIFTEKKIPKLALMGSHFPAEPPGVFQLAVIFWYGHVHPLRPRFARPPLPKGEASDALNALHRTVYRSAALICSTYWNLSFHTNKKFRCIFFIFFVICYIKTMSLIKCYCFCVFL